MQSLKLLILLTCFFWFGCGQDFNSNSGDAAIGGDSGLTCVTQAEIRFCNAYEVIRNNYCFQCHSSWADYKTESEWVSAGLVVAGSTSSSKVINRLSNSGSNMPLGYGALSSADYNTLLEWVRGM